MLGNLVENARNAGASSIELSVAKPGFAVKDNGRGIPAELLPRIFEPRFSTTTQRVGAGARDREAAGRELGCGGRGSECATRKAPTVAIAWPDGNCSGSSERRQFPGNADRVRSGGPGDDLQRRLQSGQHVRQTPASGSDR